MNTPEEIFLGEIEEQMKKEQMKKEQMKKEQMKYKQQQQLDKHNEEIQNRIKNDKSNDVITVSKRPTINNLTALLKETKPKGGYKKSIRTRKNTKNNKSFRRKSNKIVKYKRVKSN